MWFTIVSPIVYIFYIGIVRVSQYFFVSDEIVCTHFILTHETHSVHYTLFVCIRIIIFVVGYLKMSKDVCTLYYFTDTQYIGDCWDDMTYKLLQMLLFMHLLIICIRSIKSITFIVEYLKGVQRCMYILLRVCERKRIMVFNRLILCIVLYCMRERYILDG